MNDNIEKEIKKEKNKMKKTIKEIRKLTMVVTVLTMFISIVWAQPMVTDIGVNDVSGEPNTIVSIPVNVTNVQKESIAGIVFDVTFDSSVINLTKAQKGDLTVGWDTPSARANVSAFQIPP